jgi:capsular exopolysaccharide synthesis family protein
VLLVDSDLRKPQIHYRLGVDNINGLSNLLTDEAPDWRSLITPVSNHIGWDLLTAGPQPPDPPRLLSSQRMANLVQDITTSGDYDTVIVDTPPALGLADASLVAENMDGLLMVVSLGQVPRDLPKQAIRRIREAGAPVLGVITNSRQVRRGRDVTTAYSYSAYGYGYGYGYGSSGYNNGSYSHDPLLAYSSRKEKGPKGWKAAIPTPANIRRNMRRTVRGINKWLDE